MTPNQFLLELWPKIHEIHPELKFQMVHFDTGCTALALMRVPICCARPRR